VARCGLVIEYYFFGSGFVLSSTSLNLDSCLYARKTINAIIRKSIIFETRSKSREELNSSTNDSEYDKQESNDPDYNEDREEEQEEKAGEIEKQL
jgi:hypothetical protein